ALDPRVLGFYEEEVATIMALDPEDVAGLKSKYQPVLDAKANAEKEQAVVAFLQPLQAMLRDGDHAAALARVEEAIAKFAPKEELLVNLRMVKVQINMQAGNVAAALGELDQAIEAAPAELKGQLRQVRQQIEQAAAQQ